MSTDERCVVTRTIAASPAEIFAVLSDPSRHKDTEPGDWVRDAIDTEPITGTGQIFAVNMFLERLGGPYVMHNLVTVFEQDRTIALVARATRRRGQPPTRRLVVALRPCAERGGHRRHPHLRLERRHRRSSATRSAACHRSEWQFIEDSLDALGRSVAPTG